MTGPSSSTSGHQRVIEDRVQDPKKVELEKFSVRPEKFGGKGAFQGLVNQFEEYNTLEQWSNNKRSSLLFL